MPKNPDFGDLDQALDQLTGVLDSVAMVMGGYYDALIRHGVPPEFAAELVRDFHSGYWDKQFYLDEE